MKIKNEQKNYKGFTLIELLVVVLIIGILAAIALPQYRMAVEKSRMAEAILLSHKIAEMSQMYYMVNGKYPGAGDIDKLDITIPGSKNNEGRLLTKYFVYSPTACTDVCNGTTPWLSYVKRISNKDDTVNGPFAYSIFIYKTTPNRIHCSLNSGASSEQKILCTNLERNGNLD